MPEIKFEDLSGILVAAYWLRGFLLIEFIFIPLETWLFSVYCHVLAKPLQSPFFWGWKWRKVNAGNGSPQN
jgi:hypothetical protein